jgi:methionyl-tRNA synthetase
MLKGMDDLSVSRLSAQAPWGITVPSDEAHTVYVWLDALANYLTVARHHVERSGINFEQVWPPTYHVVGKDILKFHAVYWPAFLSAAGLPLPKQVIAHAHWLVENQKMSKSIGNVVAPSDLVRRFGVDAVRYFLLRDGGLVNDGDFSESMLVQRANKELADVYGNLVRRCTAKLKVWPSSESLSALDDDPSAQDLLRVLNVLPSRVDTMYRRGDIQHAGITIMSALNEANAFFQNHEPWAIAKQLRTANAASNRGNGDGDTVVDVDVDVEALQKRLDAINLITLESIRVTTILLQPMVPSVATKVLDGLGLSAHERGMKDACRAIVVTDCRPLIQPIGVVFAKIDQE